MFEAIGSFLGTAHDIVTNICVAIAFLIVLDWATDKYK